MAVVWPLAQVTPIQVSPVGSWPPLAIESLRPCTWPSSALYQREMVVTSDCTPVGFGRQNSVTVSWKRNLPPTPGSRSHEELPLRGPWGSPSSGTKLVRTTLATLFTPFAGSRTLSNVSVICRRARSDVLTEARAVKSNVTTPLFSTASVVPASLASTEGPECVIDPHITLTNESDPLAGTLATSSSKS